MTDGPIVDLPWAIMAADVRKDGRHADRPVQLVPVANPAGRVFVLAGNVGCAGARRSTVACAGFSVDLNRNFDIGWESAKYYSKGDEAKIIKAGGTDPSCSEIFRGKGAGTEKQTANIQRLIDDGDVRYSMDVHAHGRRVHTLRGAARAGRSVRRPQRIGISLDSCDRLASLAQAPRVKVPPKCEIDNLGGAQSVSVAPWVRGAATVNEVVIIGPPAIFAQLGGIVGLLVDHPTYGEDETGQHVLTADATDEAILEIEALGLTVELMATEEEQNTQIAQLIEEGGTDVTDIDIA